MTPRTERLHLLLSNREASAVRFMAAELAVEPTELVWACVDALLAEAIDEGVEANMLERIHQRFDQQRLPSWAVHDRMLIVSAQGQT